MQHEREILIRCLDVAGKILMENFGKLKAYDQKHDQSNIVTQADLDSENAMVEILSDSFPQHNIIAEETGYQNKNSEYTWIIDPLDGTSNYAVGIPMFGVIVALLHHNQPILGGVYLPFLNELFIAEKNKGLTRNGLAVSVSNETTLKNVLWSYCIDYAPNPIKTANETKIIQQLVGKVRNLRTNNCVADFCFAADGRYGGCINQTTKIWDIAAPVLFMQEAGGIATDINGNAIDFAVTAENFDKNFTIICTSKLFQAEVMQMIGV